MGLSELVYCPLMEEKEDKQHVGWSKVTIEYALKNIDSIKKSIRGMIKNVNQQLNYHDVDDIFQKALEYLYRGYDYDIDKAYERSANGNSPVSVEGYVYTCVKFCVKRYSTECKLREKHTIHDIYNDANGKEASILDNVADKNADYDFSTSSYTLDEVCRDNESKRYKYGADLFLIFYVRLRLQLVNKEDKYEQILNILNITNKDMQNVCEGTSKDGTDIEIAKAITQTSLSEATRIIGRYTYSVHRINELIDLA